MKKHKHKSHAAPGTAPADAEWEDGDKLAEQAKADAVESEKPVADEDADPGEPGAFPEKLQDSFAMLAELEKMPERTPKEERAKRGLINPLKDHIFRLQQGLPTIHLTADDLHHSQKGQTAILRQQKLEAIARENLEVRQLLTDYERVVKENEELRAELEK